MVSRHVILFAGLAVLLAASLLLAQEPARPLTESELIRLLEAGVTPARVATLVNERRVSFEMSPEVEQRLRQAGADDALIAALARAAAPPEEAIRHLKLAELKAHDNDRAAAQAELAEAATLAPNWAELHYQSGLTYETLRLYEQAIASWRRYLELQPDTPRKSEMVAKLTEWEYRREKQKKAETLLQQASEELKKFNVRGAQDLARQAVEADPESAAAQTKLAEYLFATRAYDEAITHAREAVRLDPQFAEGHRQLARTLREKSELAEAEREARTAVRLAPNEERTHSTLAVVLVRQGKAEEALAEARTIARLDPGGEGNGLIQIAGEFANRKDWSSARAIYRDYLAEHPDHVMMRVNLALILTRQGDLAEAEREAREAVRRDPQNPAAHDALAMVLAAQKQWDAAVAELQEAVRLDPKSTFFQMRLAWVYRQKESPQSAVAVYRELIQSNPNYVPAHIQLARTLRGLKDFTGALIPARAAVRLQSTSETHTLLATVLNDGGQLDEAYKEYQEALRLDPNNATAHWDLGVHYQRRGDMTSAMAEYREAARLNPNSQFYREHLSRLEQWQKQQQK